VQPCRCGVNRFFPNILCIIKGHTYTGIFIIYFLGIKLVSETFWKIFEDIIIARIFIMWNILVTSSFPSAVYGGLFFIRNKTIMSLQSNGFIFQNRWWSKYKSLMNFQPTFVRISMLAFRGQAKNSTWPSNNNASMVALLYFTKIIFTL